MRVVQCGFNAFNSARWAQSLCKVMLSLCMYVSAMRAKCQSHEARQRAMDITNVQIGLCSFGRPAH